ncbi:hypothetical protein ACHAPO_004411 [Fusarium lateritium]
MNQFQRIQTSAPSYTIVDPDQQFDYEVLIPSDGHLTTSFIWIYDQERHLTVLKDFITSLTKNPSGLTEGTYSRHCVLLSFYSHGTTGDMQQWIEVRDAVRKLGAIIESESRIVGRENVSIVAFREGCGVGLMYLMEADGPLGAFCGCKLRIPFLSDISYIGELGKHPTQDFQQFIPTQGLEDQEPDTPMTTGE